MFCKLTDDLVFIMEGCGVLGTVRPFDICLFIFFFTLVINFLLRAEAVRPIPPTWSVIKFYAMVYLYASSTIHH